MLNYSVFALQIWFPEEFSTFLSRPEHSPPFPDMYRSCGEYEPEDMEWITGIHTHLTCLNRLSLIDEGRRILMSEPPAVVQQALDAANIESFMKLRAPVCNHTTH
jgi:hypothetical protein